MVVSVSPVGSASGAASYYASDNYYLAGDTIGEPQWGGEGAEKLGLVGAVDADAFEKILSGQLPNGQTLTGGAKEHRAGIDLTFSPPKSVSLVALIGVDQRVIAAHAKSVQTAMSWAEENLAEARQGKNGRQTVQTGNLTYASFTHNLSRALDPQLHTHVVVANMTRRPDGEWRALKNDGLFKENTLIASIYHAQLRAELTKLGYGVELTGKHGSFEISGVDRGTIEAWSSRAADIRARAEELGIQTPQGLRAVAQRSRDDKHVVSHADLKAHWNGIAERTGTNLAPLIEAAVSQAEPHSKPRGVMDRVRDWGRALIDRVTQHFGPKPEPLMAGADIAKRSVSLAAAYAVAAGVRHVSERAATFDPRQLLRAALNFAEHGATIKEVEARIDQLTYDRVLISREVAGQHLMTTRDLIKTERAMINQVRGALGSATPLLTPKQSSPAIDKAAAAKGLDLSSEQKDAAKVILAGDDRVQLVQGDAGSGKTTLFSLVRDIAQARGVEVLALTPQHKLAGELRQDTGMKVGTVAAFLARHEQAHRGNSLPAIDRAKAEIAGKILIVDEASMIAHRQMVGLMDIAAKGNAAKLVLVGDAKQIDPVEAGRPFALLQAAGAPTARLSENRRQVPDDLREAVTLAKQGLATDALNALGARVAEHTDPAKTAAQTWLSLSEAERECTTLFTSGHRLRHELLAEIRAGMIAQGTLGKNAIILTVHQNLNHTTEELRRVSTYEEGQVLDIYRYQPGIDLERGRYEIAAVDGKRGTVMAEKDGKTYQFDPNQVAPNSRGVSLSAKSEIEVRQGDRLMWTDNDRKRDIANGATSDVVAIRSNAMVLQDRHGEIELRLDDPMANRLTHGLVLNMHKAQGLTVDKAITVMDSRDHQLNSSSLFYVLSSRAREDLTVFTDDKAALGRSIENHGAGHTHASSLIERATEPLGKVAAQRSAPTPTANKSNADLGAKSMRERPELARPQELILEKNRDFGIA